jgi:predicted Fe-Mo cluster-binding NifX family protein
MPLQGKALAPSATCARTFSFFVASGLSGKVSHEDEIPAPENRPDLWPLWLADKLVDAIVVHSINDRLKNALEQAGIAVFIAGVTDKDPRNLAAECYSQTAFIAA